MGTRLNSQKERTPRTKQENPAMVQPEGFWCIVKNGMSILKL